MAEKDAQQTYAHGEDSSSRAAGTGGGDAAVTPPSTRAALLRFRVIAYVVGVVLVALVFVAMPMKYLGGDSTLVELIGPVHGFLYVVYLVLGLDLAIRTRMKPLPVLLVLLAGTVPFLSFVAERRVTRWVRSRPAPAPLR